MPRQVTTPTIAALWLGLLAGALPCVGFAQEWQVIAQRDGIVVSRRQLEDRRLPELRSQGEVAGTPYEILAVLLDVPAYQHWVPDCAEARTVRTLGAWHRIVYTRTDLPWPLRDREAVVDQQVTFVRAPALVTVTFAAIEGADVPHATDTVRTDIAAGSYTIEAIGERRSRVTYQVNADPGGSLPDWLIRMQSRRNPLGALAGLRRRVEETRGQYDEQIGSYPPGG